MWFLWEDVVLHFYYWYYLLFFYYVTSLLYLFSWHYLIIIIVYSIISYTINAFYNNKNQKKISPRKGIFLASGHFKEHSFILYHLPFVLKKLNRNCEFTWINFCNSKTAQRWMENSFISLLVKIFSIKLERNFAPRKRCLLNKSFFFLLNYFFNVLFTCSSNVNFGRFK